jgi:hypothetical protein
VVAPLVRRWLFGDSGEESVEALVGEAPVEWAGGGLVARFERGQGIGKLCEQAMPAEANPKCCKESGGTSARSQRRRSARKLGAAARRPTHADAGYRPADGLVLHCSSRVPHRVRYSVLPIRRWKAKIHTPNTAGSKLQAASAGA